MSAVLFMSSCEKEDLPTLSPEMKSVQVTNVESGKAQVSGFVIAGDFDEYGICYGTNESPTTADGKVAVDPKGKAMYTAELSELSYATTYYARAYASNSTETLYGAQLSFTTAPIIPAVTTVEPSDVTGITAVSGGNVVGDGGATVTSKGVCWGESETVTLESAAGYTDEGEGMGEYVSNISGLNGLTTYYVRAYATNTAGTSYGEVMSFTTLIADITWYVPGNHQGWDPATAPTIKNSTENPNTISGYVWLDGEFKFTAGPNWNVNYGDNDADGTLDADGANFNATEAGLYRIIIDFAAMTCVYTKTDWGVIGSGTAGGWDSDQDMVYSAATNALYANLTLSDGEIKFRANDNWNLNYGDAGADGTLEEGADNIAVTAGDYTVMFNPSDLTYSVNTWGLIGSATAGGWDSDTDMTIDGNNWVLTTDLVAGEIKFRANDAWDINYGDSGADGTLDNGGDNIAIAEAGNYTITLDLVNNTYTVVKN